MHRAGARDGVAHGDLQVQEMPKGEEVVMGKNRISEIDERLSGENYPAFPIDLGQYIHHGMTLRDWFAGHALTGIMQLEFPKGGFGCQETMAKLAYEYADAMLEARAK